MMTNPVLTLKIPVEWGIPEQMVLPQGQRGHYSEIELGRGIEGTPSMAPLLTQWRGQMEGFLEEQNPESTFK